MIIVPKNSQVSIGVNPYDKEENLEQVPKDWEEKSEGIAIIKPFLIGAGTAIIVGGLAGYGVYGSGPKMDVSTEAARGLTAIVAAGIMSSVAFCVVTPIAAYCCNK